MTTTIQTPRLSLHTLTPEVYELVFSSYNDKELMQFFGFDSEEALAKERMKAEGGMTTFRTTMFGFRLIEKATNQVLGIAGFHTWFPDHARAEIGYALHHDRFKGKGYMKEALPYVIAHGFHTMKLHRIEALVSPTNIPSLRLIKHLGFVQEGTLREHYYTKGKMDDSLMFSLLRHEYLNQHPHV